MFPALATILAVPAFFAVTLPFELTVATLFLLLDHFTFCFVPVIFDKKKQELLSQM